MPDWLTTDRLFLLAGLIGAVALLVPYFVTALRASPVWFRVTDDPNADRPVWWGETHDRRAAELAALGFRPVGRIDEVVWLSFGHLRKEFPVPRFHHPGLRCYAGVYQLDSFPGLPVRVALETPTVGGRMVQTAMPGVDLVSRDPELHRSEVPDGPLAGMLDGHQREVVQCVAEWRDEPADLDLPAFARLAERLERRANGNIGIGSAWTLPAVYWAAPTVLVAAAAWLFGLSAERAAAGGLLAGNAVYLLFMWRLYPALRAMTEHVSVPGAADAPAE